MTHLLYDRPKKPIEPGVWYSPGYYMEYWDLIKDRYDLEQIEKTQLQKHREAWVGAILAASQVATTGRLNFVGIPKSDHPDVEVFCPKENIERKGAKFTPKEVTPVEITRCDWGAGDTLLGQILKKHRPKYKAAYGDVVLAVYEYNRKVYTDYRKVHDELKEQQKEVFFSQIVVLTNFDSTPTRMRLEDGTFAITELYPNCRQRLLNIFDPSIFFEYPRVVRKKRTAKGIGYIGDDSFELLVPDLKDKTSSSSLLLP